MIVVYLLASWLVLLTVSMVGLVVAARHFQRQAFDEMVAEARRIVRERTVVR